MSRFSLLRCFALAAAAGLYVLSGTAANAQQPGRSRLIPNPVASAGGRVNIPDPQRHQGNGQFRSRTGGQHNGVDLTANAGTPVQAVDGGTVIRSVNTQLPDRTRWNSQQQPYSTANDPLPPDSNDAGNRVTIRHADGSTSAYFHLSGDGQPSVGDRVVPGQVIGNVGRTGNVPTNADTHLHFETRDRNGTPTRPQIDGIPSTQLQPVTTAPQTPVSSGPISLPSTGPAVTPRQAGTSSQTAGFRFR